MNSLTIHVKFNMHRTNIFAIIAGIGCFILAVIEKQAGLDLGIAPYIGICIIYGLLSIATDRNN